MKTSSWITCAWAFWLCSGCASTTTRPDDAFEPSPDVTVLQDAGVDAYAPSLDAFTPDAPGDAFSPDAVTPPPDAFSPDAFVLPPDICNNVDDDFDGAIDEGGALACSLTSHGERAVCESGVCLCRATGTPPVAGSYADCNASWADGCETELGTNTNCAECGDVCGPASDCHAHGGVYACGPANILDFSIPERDGEIACIVRTDHRLVCRGLNSDFAISDSEPAGAVLDWTLVPDGAGVKEVRAWRRAPVDGRSFLSICVLNDDNAIRCRGDNSTGLLKLPDLTPHRGWAGVRPRVLEVVIWGTWSGTGVVLSNNQVPINPFVWVWGGAIAPGRLRYVGAMGGFPRFDVDVPTLVFPNGYTRAWGPEIPNLTPPGWIDLEPSRPLYPVRPGWLPHARDLGCSRDVCCVTQGGGPDPGGSPLTVGCWGRTARPVGEITDVSVVGSVDFRLSWDTGRMIELAPRSDGRIEGCIRTVPDGGRPTRFFCADMTTAADTLGPVSPEPFHEEPSRVFDGRTPQARVDWQAMCIQHRPDWWQCWGTHEGWGRE